jgi:hypothetical protein
MQSALTLPSLADALPAKPDAVAEFMADQAATGSRPSTLSPRLAAIRYAHRAAGYDTPTADERVRPVLAGVRRTVGAAPVRKKAATSDVVIAMAAPAASLRALRDRAILLLGLPMAIVPRSRLPSPSSCLYHVNPYRARCAARPHPLHHGDGRTDPC